MGITTITKDVLILILIPVVVLSSSIIACIVCHRRSRQHRRRALQNSVLRRANTLRFAPQGLTGDNSLVRSPPSAYLPRIQVSRAAIPQPRRERQQTILSQPSLSSYFAGPDLETRNGDVPTGRTSLNLGQTPAGAAASHRRCPLTRSYGNGEQYIRADGSLAAPISPACQLPHQNGSSDYEQFHMNQCSWDVGSQPSSLRESIYMVDDNGEIRRFMYF